jgi:C4-dicarboxylate transporter, DctQ subunit
MFYKETQMSILGKVGQSFDKTLDIMAYICMFFIAFIIFTMVLDITLRATIRQTLGPITDIDRLLLVYLPFLGGAWLLRREGHVNVDLILARLPRIPQSILLVLFSMIGIILGILMVWYGGKLTIELIQRDSRTLDILETPMWVYQIPVPIGGLLLFGQFIRRTYACLIKWKNKEPQMRNIYVANS